MPYDHNLTVEEWRSRRAAAPLTGPARLELLDGEAVDVPPGSTRHADCVEGVAKLLVSAVGDRAVVSVQSPVELDRRSEPRPDVAVLQPRPDWYAGAPATAREIMMLIEVSDTTLIYDRGRKASYYAGVGVPECWVVDLAGGQVLVMRTPASAGYRDVRTLRRGAVINAAALGGVELSIDDVLGPGAA
jgi:Uma2 family endonuclease